jgi:hypothetical protein
MNGVDIAIVIILVLLVAVAVAAGLQLAQDRAEAHLAAVRKEVHEWQVESGAQNFCANCGADLRPPT